MGRADSLDTERLFLNLGQLVGSLSTGGKVAAYEQIAAQLSALAGLKNGHSWGWRYIASVHSRTIEPSKKFLRVLVLLLKKISPHKKQWFYFMRRRSVAAIIIIVTTVAANQKFIHGMIVSASLEKS